MPQTIEIRWKKGIRTDGEVEVVTINQQGFGEIRLTLPQAESLHRLLGKKLEKYSSPSTKG